MKTIEALKEKVLEANTINDTITLMKQKLNMIKEFNKHKHNGSEYIKFGDPK